MRPPTRALFFIGAGEKAFCAGSDIGELVGRSIPDEYGGTRLGRAFYSRIESLRIPSIAIVNGYALGGGGDGICPGVQRAGLLALRLARDAALRGSDTLLHDGFADRSGPVDRLDAQRRRQRRRARVPRKAQAGFPGPVGAIREAARVSIGGRHWLAQQESVKRKERKR